ncbi:putative serine/threonine-protein kinase [Amborella trichopoda]|uniref:putative serine/threonine-protein kinase n=1 Tax=Amborella trichopoda TaxID=13333 RepID=UPI0009BFCCD6|nr:putative serine/threonine-protein kinase [Amborella trichopoda]|eukprot:XP_006830569.3 putative serine/threonine-protein kinase [Amborella trichopoda]
MVLTLVMAFTALLLIVLLIRLVQNKKEKDTKSLQALPSMSIKEVSTWSGLYRFSKEEIENAMNSINPRVCLGYGSAGIVYKGVLPSGQVVAIKHIQRRSTADSFYAEVHGLSRIRHPNLVCLFGCCEEDQQQYLVYEYCPNGNLSYQLRRNETFLSWERRLTILRDCALALRFLHNYPDGCIVHRDIKLTNILLGENFEAKLSDFGLAKMLGMEQSKVFTEVKGTIGYMDPEYASNATLTLASDIYSFGIVILQILSGRRVIELDVLARDTLARTAKDVNSGIRPLSDLVDPKLNGKYDEEHFRSILYVAVLCVAQSSDGRPDINNVYDVMENAYKHCKSGMGLDEISLKIVAPKSRPFDIMKA